ncbi:YciI family protein [Paenibacillus apiarius]|uniref:YciI family protein n=1 Tax=Paenibacillus apiarius TaxID=46240 RepID=A0ABT4DND3_9BACL|nr:YciI family protein [Paenibacillus apiarius]MCY9515458.1 YciI family protein [Paenibacillus apiarius]MCY9518867.1 YciI family protein [Paenibacillus apiarius]MCY9552086.1 YciI family protein [Paenibacillus apiarius]MCY9557238.1 YciI family protein [Paenibacillus apiarius]MCY9682584.1 YciI family protein [Paenibacillus apiarius]
MYVVELTYTKPMAEVDVHLDGHRSFLDEQYAQGKFIISGPKEPRTGGIIVVDAQTEEEARRIIEQDPFWAYGVAEYRFIAFKPTKAVEGLHSRLF